jgi:molybdenum cofactor synthesis domain-containing protein
MRVSILTVSDRSSRGEREDLAGPKLEEYTAARGWALAQRHIVPDERQQIQQTLLDWCDSGEVDLILTTGGTGFGLRDVTPEATRQVIEREAPGLAEAMRIASMRITPHAMLSRGVCGIRGGTLIVNLPGSPRAAVENLEVIMPALPHAVELLQDDPEAEKGHRPGIPSKNA